MADEEVDRLCRCGVGIRVVDERRGEHGDAVTERARGEDRRGAADSGEETSLRAGGLSCGGCGDGHGVVPFSGWVGSMVGVGSGVRIETPECDDLDVHRGEVGEETVQV